MATWPGKAILVALMFAAAGDARAGGSVETGQVIGLAGQSPKVMSAIAEKLDLLGRDLSDVGCAGTRLGRHYKNLGGARIAPYICTVGSDEFEILGEVRFYDAKGRENNDPAEAAYIGESQPDLRWP